MRQGDSYYLMPGGASAAVTVNGQAARPEGRRLQHRDCIALSDPKLHFMQLPAAAKA